MTIDGISAGGRSFVDSLEEMVLRLERVERLARLMAAPVLPYKDGLTLSFFNKYLGDRCSLNWNEDEKPWKTGNTAGEFIHKKTTTTLQLPGDWDENKEDALVDCLLVIAALEERLPARVIVDIQPNLFPSAVDAMVAGTQEIPG